MGAADHALRRTPRRRRGPSRRARGSPRARGGPPAGSASRGRSRAAPAASAGRGPGSRRDVPRERASSSSARPLLDVVRDVGDVDAEAVAVAASARPRPRRRSPWRSRRRSSRCACSRKSRRPEQVLLADLLRERLRLRHDGLREARRQVVRAQHDLDVDARALRGSRAAPRRRRGRRAARPGNAVSRDLDDLALARAAASSRRRCGRRRRASGRTGRTICAPVLRLEASDHALARPVEHRTTIAGGRVPASRAAPAAARGSAPRARGPCRRPSRRASRTRGTKRSSPPGTRTKPKPSGRTVSRPATRFENSIAEYFSPRTRAISPRRSSASSRSRRRPPRPRRRRRPWRISAKDRTREPFWRRRSRISESRGSTRRSLPAPRLENAVRAVYDLGSGSFFARPLCSTPSA